MKLPISSIQIGERRREDMGDITELAHSLGRYGLLQPIVVDNESNLIAGHRRLMAAQELGWLEIDVRAYGDLTELERRELELEENERRKNLTAYERSKQYIEKAKVIAPTLVPEASGTNQPRGEPRKYEATKEDIAQALGIHRDTLLQAESHSRAVDAYPELRPWSQDTAVRAAAAFNKYPEIRQPGVAPGDAINLAERLDRLPDEERDEKREALQRGDPYALADAAGLPPAMPELRQWQDAYRKVSSFVRDANQLTARWNDRALLILAENCRELAESLTSLEETTRGRVTDELR